MCHSTLRELDVTPTMSPHEKFMTNFYKELFMTKWIVQVFYIDKIKLIKQVKISSYTAYISIFLLVTLVFQLVNFCLFEEISDFIDILSFVIFKFSSRELNSGSRDIT